MFSVQKRYIITLFIVSVFGFTYYVYFISKSYLVETVSNQLKVNISIFPRDHLDGVHLEVDGDVNMDYLREILFGVDHHLISADNKDVAVKIIKKLFYLNDKNHDKVLDQEEVYKLISSNINSHIDKAKRANHETFSQLKGAETNYITWKNYVRKYFQLINKPNDFIELYLKKMDKILLSDTEINVLNNAQQNWKNADIDGNSFLSESEFLGFLHPELNFVTLNRMCDQILLHLDRNADGLLSEKEFVDKSNNPKVEIVTPYPGYVISKEDADIISDSEESRQRNFREQIDLNHDGVANRTELIEYINPRNQFNIFRDAQEIIKTIDKNADNNLSLSEMITNYQKVISSKMVNIAAAFHNSDL